MANRSFTRSFYTPHTFPVKLDCNFVVDDTQAAGVSSLEGPGVAAVYMHSATTSSYIANPDAGYIVVQLQDPYYEFFGMSWSAQGPVTGSAISISGAASLNIGAPYSITSVGTTTQAQWQAAGLPPGLTPAVGQTFIAKINGSGTGTGQVKALALSGVSNMEICGNPELTLAPVGISNTLNQIFPYIVLQCSAPTDASTTTLIPTAPAAGTILRLELYLGNSSVKVQGE